MCRLALCDNKYFNNKGIKKMKVFLDHLERECGGHGNGYLFIKKNKLIGFKKGVELKNIDILMELFETQPDWFIYHTRVASVGGKSDYNCHPFVDAKRTFGLCMNGTENEFGALAGGLGITDTQLIFHNLNTFNISEDTLTDMSSKFMGFRNGKVFATNPCSYGYGGLKFVDDKKGLCIASSFPVGFEDYKDMRNGYIWKEGKRVEENIFVGSSNKWQYVNGKWIKPDKYEYDEDAWYYDQYCTQKKEDEKKIEEKEIESKKMLSEYSLYDVIDELNEEIEAGLITATTAYALLIEEYGNSTVKTVKGSRHFKMAQDCVFLVDNAGKFIY